MLTPEEEMMLQEALDSESGTDAQALVPENSPTILIEDSTSRFSGATWYDKVREMQVSVLGVGGIGSNLAFLLSRLGIKRLIMYDPDVVEEANMSGQLYRFSDIGVHKVEAISNVIRSLSNYYSCYTDNNGYTASSSPTQIMMCGFDNMRARKTAFDSWCRIMEYYNEKMRKESLFMDGRLNLEEFQIFAIQGDDDRAKNEYRDKWLFDDSQAEELECSRKQTTFMASMIASVMVNIFTNFITNLVEPLESRCVPFFTYYNAALMYNKMLL